VDGTAAIDDEVVHLRDERLPPHIKEGDLPNPKGNLVSSLPPSLSR
jgi:hypothetical protein